MNKHIKNYTPPDRSLWNGRKSNLAAENQYWYQEIKLIDINDNDAKQNDIALIGYACDEGVKRNFGRVGAKDGPDIIKKRLAKLPIHFKNLDISDVGNIVCLDNNMESSQISLSTIIEKLIRKQIFPIAIGGGHDISYGHFKGIYNALITKEKNKIGIVNFDAHFDLRPIESHPNSGTPFNQILSEFSNVHYFVLGIQQQSNTKELFAIAEKNKVAYAYDDECETTNSAFKKIEEKLHHFIKKIDYLYITIDLDGFSSAFAPGVSAPSPFGFQPKFVYKVLDLLFNTKKVISLDVAEMNPKFDINNSTEILAAKLIDFCVQKINSIKINA